MSRSVDILVLGATGFTGRLISRYLYTHPERASFTFGIGARSESKLAALAKDLGLDESVKHFIVDVTQPTTIAAAVQQVRVVINAVGPFWKWGTPVVAACVENKAHYLDLTGETPWIRDLIPQFHARAGAGGTILVNSCGLDSVPSDISAFLSAKALKAIDANATIDESTTAIDYQGGFSGGTYGTFIASFDDIPKDKLAAASKNYSISPIKGEPGAGLKLIYKQPHTQTLGGVFFLAAGNRALVERTWGLLEGAAQDGGEKRNYGPQFKYTEFAVAPSVFRALLTSIAVILGFTLLGSITWFRNLVKRLVPPPGTGPSEEDMVKGYLTGTNISTSTPAADGSRIVVKSILRCRGDPGYLQTAVMISEAALSIVLDYDDLPAFGKRGGLLTPMSALGEVLIGRLEKTGTFDFEYGRYQEGGDKKRV